MATDTKQELIQLLNSQTDAITVKEIAARLSVSTRTVRNYLLTLRTEYPDSIISGQSGIILRKKLRTEHDEHFIPTSYSQRRRFILSRILLKTNSLILDDIASELFISVDTLVRTIVDINKELRKDGLRIRVKDNRLSLSGPSTKMRFLLSQLIFHDASQYLSGMQSLQVMFPHFNIPSIRKTIDNTLKKNRLFIDEFSINNFMVHLLICMQSPQLSSYSVLTTSDGDNKVSLPVKIRDAVDEICCDINNQYGLIIPKTYRYQFGLFLTTRSFHDVKPNQIDDSPTTKLVAKMIAVVKNTYNIDLDTESFRVNFSIHLNNMLLRLRNGVRLHNSMVNNIKFTAPFIYEIAVLLGHIIYQKTHLTVNDDEIAYIALHVGTRIEEINSYKDKVRVCFVFPEYYSFRNNPLHEHFAEFTNDIVITNIYTSPLQITDNVDADLVITTVQINISRPSVIISSFVTPDDKRKIRNAIDSIRKHKASRNFQHILRSIFDPNLYQRISQYESREVAINQIGSLLKEKCYVDDEYIQKTIEREKVSATNFGKIAIPHPIDYYVPTSSIAVTILKKPLIWGTSTINVIFMLAISKSDYSYIQDVFPFLVRICSNPQQLEQIAASTSADNFMQLLLDFTK